MLTSELRIVRRIDPQGTPAAVKADDADAARIALEAHAQFDGPERAVHVRLAEHAGYIYLDLPMTAGVLSRWEPADGLSSARLRSFRRAAGMLPLAVPQPSGAIEELTSFLNLRNQSGFVLVVAWLLTAGGGPYPLLAISGEQGSAKTVLTKLLKALVEPDVAPASVTGGAYRFTFRCDEKLVSGLPI